MGLLSGRYRRSGRRNRIVSAGKRRPERTWESGRGGEQFVLAGLLVLHKAVAAQLGQQLVALVGPGGDQLVVGVQHDVEARAVEIAAAAADGEQIEARLRLEP